MKILVIIPAFNESKNIEDVINRVKKVAPFADYLVVNDCSSDDTKEILKAIHANYISLPVNLGIGGCVQAGYVYAYENGYDIAIQLDGDGQHDPKYIKEMIDPIICGSADIVIGSRYLTNEGYQSSNTRRFGIKFLSKLIKICSGAVIKDVTSGFRAINRKYLKLYAKEYAQDYPEPEAIIAAAMYGAKIKEFPVVMCERNNGTSSINKSKAIYYMIKVSLTIILYRFTFKKEEV